MSKELSVKLFDKLVRQLLGDLVLSDARRLCARHLVSDAAEVIRTANIRADVLVSSGHLYNDIYPRIEETVKETLERMRLNNESSSDYICHSYWHSSEENMGWMSRNIANDPSIADDEDRKIFQDVVDAQAALESAQRTAFQRIYPAMDRAYELFYGKKLPAKPSK